MQRHLDPNGDLVMVTEQRGVEGGRRGHVVIRVSIAIPLQEAAS
jgi:hypothetical protein